MIESELLGKVITGLLTGVVTISVCLINNAVQLKRDRANREEAYKKQLEDLRSEMAKQIMDIRADFMAHLEELIATQQDITNRMQLFSYQLEELGKRVEKHNNVVERTYALEKQMDLHEEKIKVANNRISDIEEEHKKKA